MYQAMATIGMKVGEMGLSDMAVAVSMTISMVVNQTIVEVSSREATKNMKLFTMSFMAEEKGVKEPTTIESYFSASLIRCFHFSTANIMPFF